MERPVIFDYRAVPAFVQAMLEWRKAQDPKFSIRRSLKGAIPCSPGLITLVAQGKRNLTRERVEAFAKILELNREETTYLDRWVALQRKPHMPTASETEPSQKSSPVVPRRPAAQNHLLTNWLNVYVKDLCELRGFEPDPITLSRMLGGIATPRQIQRSLDFLVKNGYFRRTLKGQLVKNERMTVTTDDIPDAKIKAFHKNALKLATRAVDLYPVERRRANALVIALNQSSVEELKTLLKDFYERLLVFLEEHPDDDEQLYQVLLNLTPIGGACEN
ncbi:TIGR02147 family protein [Bdellovibrionota bacterium FG-1]